MKQVNKKKTIHTCLKCLSLYNKYISLHCSSCGVFSRFNKTVQHISVSTLVYVSVYVKNLNLVVVTSDEIKESWQEIQQ